MATETTEPIPTVERSWFGRVIRYFRLRKRRSIALFLTFAHILGALTSVQAIMTTRTSQGAIAWAISLNTFPYVAVPAYWIFGRSKFEGYIKKRRGDEEKTNPVVSGFIAAADQAGLLASGHGDGKQMSERLTWIPATTGNQVELLRNGGEIFPSIFKGIDEAKSYILIQFYIVRDDVLGQQLKDRLIAASRRGVKVHFVYDEIGSYGLADQYMKELQQERIEILPFNTTKGISNRFQINFRNHRKIVVVDGTTAWVGGANIGDEYTSNHQDMMPLYDTAVRISGPAVQTIQVSFREDWLWASGRLLEMNWDARPAIGGEPMTVFCLPTGPADRFESCTLYFLQLINSAKTRLWIASPYFVPDEQIVSALKLAAMRGVDVRIIIPEKGDSRLSDLSSWAYVTSLMEVGVKLYRHQKGFMHQKVVLIDADRATVGTANFDNRSFRLNFEITMEIRSPQFATRVEEMLEADIENSRQVKVDELPKRGFLFNLGVRAASLLSPIQ